MHEGMQLSMQGGSLSFVLTCRSGGAACLRCPTLQGRCGCLQTGHRGVQVGIEAALHVQSEPEERQSQSRAQAQSQGSDGIVTWPVTRAVTITRGQVDEREPVYGLTLIANCADADSPIRSCTGVPSFTSGRGTLAASCCARSAKRRMVAAWLRSWHTRLPATT